MAKITSIITFTDKIGNIVGMKGKDGEFYLRQHQPRPRNPRTFRQMKNRVSIPNLSTFWRSMYGKDRPSFEIKGAKESDFNAFFRVNRSATKIYLTKPEVALGCSLVTDYTITVGSLQPTICQILESNKIISDISVTSNLEFSANTTIAELSKAIMDANPGRFQMYDQLTFVYIIQKYDPIPNSNTGGRPYLESKFYKFILDQDNRAKVGTVIPVSGDFAPIVTESNNKYLGSNYTQNYGFGIVVSREVNGTTKVSTTKLLVNNSVAYLYTTASAREKAIASYGRGEDNYLTPVVDTEEDLDVNP